MHESYESDSHFFKGLFWGTVLSIPLWLSFFGWLKLLISLLN